MKIAFLLVVVFIGLAYAAQYSYEDPKLNDELESIYKQLNAPAEFVELHSFTRAEILTLTPRRVGQLYYCSDCTTDAVCVSTGTATGSFGRVSLRTTACT